MDSSARFDRNSLDAAQRDVTTWALVNLTQLDYEDEQRVLKFQTVIGRYLAGDKVSDISESTGIHRCDIIRAVKRCLQIHSDGRIWGFRALIPYTHQVNYVRTKPVSAVGSSAGRGGRSGALTQLFDRFPKLAELVERLFLKRLADNTVHESRIPLKSLHKHFLKSCRDLGLTAGDYPLNQKYLGRGALWRHLQGLMNTPAAIAARCGEDAARKLGTDGAVSSEERVLRPLDEVEFDGHRIDCIATILVPSPHGGFEEVVIERFWILALEDIATRVVLGHALSLRREYNQDDVLRCGKNAVTPWQPKTLTIPGLAYPARGSFPSDVFPDLKWAAWDTLKWDNAKAHLAKKTLDKLCTTIGCSPNPGPVADPNRRPFVERFFHTLEENGFSRLPSTTGGNPKDPRRRNPEKAALANGISLDHLEQLVAVMIANYNWDPHSGIGNRPPLEHFEVLLQDKDTREMIRKLPEEKRNNLRLLDMEVTRVVRGDMKKGRRPYIECEGVRYTNAILARSPELTGKRLRLIVNPENACTVLAFLPNGAELGLLTAHGVWGRIPHTLEARKAINVLRHRKLIYYTETDDPIQIYLTFLAAQALKSKSGAREYARAQRAQEIANAQAPKPHPKNEVSNHGDESDSLEEDDSIMLKGINL